MTVYLVWYREWHDAFDIEEYTEGDAQELELTYSDLCAVLDSEEKAEAYINADIDESRRFWNQAGPLPFFDDDWCPYDECHDWHKDGGEIVREDGRDRYVYTIEKMPVQ